MAPQGPILITGATGKQGGAVVRALLRLPSPPSILAVTRSTSSPSAQALLKLSPSIKLIQGDQDDAPAIFTTAEKESGQKVWGVFSVQVGQGFGATDETAQGKGMVDAALAHGVNFFVYSSVDRGGNDKSWNNPTDVTHFATKHAVEIYLRDKAKGSGMNWTILRPVAFMDNFEPGFQSRVFLAALNTSFKPDTKLQFVATRDIGVFAAKAFESPDEWTGKAVGIAGDDLTVKEVSKAFENATGTALTPTFGVFGSLLKMAMKEFKMMINWFAVEGYGVDVEACRKIDPSIMSLETWVRTDSKFAK